MPSLGTPAVEPDNVVLGAGADDLILLCARTFAGAGDSVAIDVAPTYPLFRIAAHLAGAEIGSDAPAVTFTCRPNNPTGSFGELSSARPLVVDEAYFEYAGETAADLIEDGVVVLRTFSKVFALAGARVGYALADATTAAELNTRQAPQPISGISAALALAALRDPPDVRWQVEERERCAAALAELGLEPLPSRANFLFVPVDEPRSSARSLLRSGLVVRVFPDGIRFSIREPARRRSPARGARRRQTVTTILPRGCPSPMCWSASAISSRGYVLSITEVSFPVSRRSRSVSMSALLNFARKNVARWLPRSALSRDPATWPIGPRRRFALGPPTTTTVAPGSSTRRSSENDRVPAMSSTRS